jgi:hypothetical protein
VRGRLSALTWALGCALVAATLLLYAPVRGFDYVQLDDPAYVTENPQVRAGLSWNGVAWAFTSGHAANWHPLTWLSHMADVEAFGVAAGPHHLVNVGLHALAALLLLIVLVRLTGAPWRSGFVAAVFALHPLHVESVAWVAERKDVLSACLWMLTLLAYTWHASAPSRGRFAAVIAMFALGLMAKPMLVTLPAVLVLLDLWPLRRWSWARPRGLWSSIVLKWPLFALAALSSLVTLVVQERGGAVASVDAVPLGHRVSTAVVGAATYLQKAVWPTDLSVIYPLPDAWPWTTVLLAAAALVAVSIVAWRAVAIAPALLVGWAWFLGTLVPVSGLVQIGVHAIADRYSYIPLIGASIMVAWVPWERWFGGVAGRAVLGAAGVAVVALMTMATHRQLPVWQNNVTLWTQAAMVTLGTDEFGAHVSLGGRLIGERRFDEAREHFTRASAIRPESAQPLHGLGLALLQAGSAAESIAPLQRAVALAPDDPNPRNDLAVAYVQTGRLEEAVREYRRLAALRPGERKYTDALAALNARLGSGK